jgi:glycine/D-amino acid oxidase-like deaminating enzyme
MRDALGSGNCSLHSWAPVVSFAESEDGEDGWTVDCGERGKITARQVIVCTNAHTRHLFKCEAIDKQ